MSLTLSEVRITLRRLHGRPGCLRKQSAWEAWIVGRPSAVKHYGRSKPEALGRCLLSLPDLPHTVILDAPPSDPAAGEGQGGEL